ncbi:MAG: hypothetical protein Q8M98_03605 [Candidatus Cloacimonadaceae bacterium]|nr:hypothetical protein [Candidatus Cloacimonadaceae bacterium]
MDKSKVTPKFEDSPPITIKYIFKDDYNPIYANGAYPKFRTKLVKFAILCS